MKQNTCCVGGMVWCGVKRGGVGGVGWGGVGRGGVGLGVVEWGGGAGCFFLFDFAAAEIAHLRGRREQVFVPHAL